MSKFKKKKGGDLPPVNTASLPDIVFMLLFFFMVVTVLRNNDLMIKNELPKADEVENIGRISLNRTEILFKKKEYHYYATYNNKHIMGDLRQHLKREGLANQCDLWKKIKIIEPRWHINRK